MLTSNYMCKFPHLPHHTQLQVLPPICMSFLQVWNSFHPFISHFFFFLSFFPPFYFSFFSFFLSFILYFLPSFLSSISLLMCMSEKSVSGPCVSSVHIYRLESKFFGISFILPLLYGISVSNSTHKLHENHHNHIRQY